MPNHFLASGVYGCVYFPGYTCKGISMKKKKLVSKLTILNEISQTEIDIGTILKQSPHYEDDFVLVERQCPIQYKSLTQMKEGCDMVKNNKSYVLLYSRFVPSKELYQYLKENTLFVRMFRCFYQLCEKVSILIQYRIVHHDLHFGNVLYGNDTSKLYIIDFGLSMIVDKLQSESYLKYIFSRYMPDWNWYPLDIHFLCYLVQHGELTQDVILSTIDTYLKDHKVFSLFKDYRKEYKRKSLSYYLPFVNQTREECIQHLLQYWNTWDFFDVALRFLNMYSQNQIQYPEYLDTLFQMVHPKPHKRLTVLELRNKNKHAIRSFDLSSSKSTYHSVDKYLSFSQVKFSQ
jgi:serine/threonine protein kinase